MVESKGNPKRAKGLARIPYTWEVEKKYLRNPNKLQKVRVWLPNGLTARFIRLTEWEKRLLPI
jgi:hypothetical protein